MHQIGKICTQNLKKIVWVTNSRRLGASFPDSRGGKIKDGYKMIENGKGEKEKKRKQEKYTNPAVDD
jgi:hypothetical protein